MSPARRKNNRRRGGSGGGAGKGKAGDLWRPVPKLSAPDRIVPAHDPTAVVRSLGDPPLQGQGREAGRVFAMVAVKAAQQATALAASADLLDLGDADDS